MVPNSTQKALESEPIPKSFARVLNASSVREDYRKRKRDGKDANESQPGRKKRKVAIEDEKLSILVRVSPNIGSDTHDVCV